MQSPAYRFFVISALMSLLLFALLSCEVEDDGSFTPQVIFVDDTPIDSSFTVEDPCLSPSCGLQTMQVDAGTSELTMEFYAGYDILRPDAKWGKLKSAIITIHGNNRNANEYFSWVSNAILSLNKQNETVVIAPQFKTSDDIGGNSNLIYWSSNGWKRGFQSSNITSRKRSSYEVVDSLIRRLADKEHFPFMEQIVITGHSAGAQFTHLYTAASAQADSFPDIEFDFVVANSQYFFYPGPERWDAVSSQFSVPTSCTNYTNWPYGTDNPTEYLANSTASEIRDRFVNRKLSYLLGSLDIFTGGTLNTTDCQATILGDNRFARGSLMFDYMETFHAGSDHQKYTVNNVGHDAAQMYNSTEAKNLFKSILEN
ncbi:MAG: hypothetical protein AB8H47_31230 [Bacteroidia bacterium]